MWLLILIIRIKKFKIYNIYVFLYFIYSYICVYDIIFWYVYLFFYRGMYDFLDYEGDDVEDVFCLIFEVSLNKFGYTR